MATSQAKTYYASTSLDLRATDTPDKFPADVYLDNTCYRRVDPPYYAWLRHRMQNAKQRFESGRIRRSAWNAMRARFNRLHDWAVAHFGMEVLQSAVRRFDPAAYAPPVNIQPPPYLFPKTGDWRFTRHVPPASVRKVDAIREAALAKGWSEARLYQNRGRFSFPLGQDYGLVCFVDPDYELGKVTDTHIQIIIPCHDRRIIQRFANADVFPPRIKK